MEIDRRRAGTLPALCLCASALLVGNSPVSGAPRPEPPIVLKVQDANDRSFQHVSLGKSPNRNISGILQDDRGFMWFAGQNRLQRYDGYEIRDYRRAAEDPNSPTSFTRSMIVGRGGKLWLSRDRGAGLAAPFGSLDEFDPVTETFQRYLEGTAPFNTPIIHVLEDRAGTLWLSTNQGLFWLDPATRHIVRVGGLGTDGVRQTLEAKDGNFWVATTRGIDLLDRTSGQIQEHYAFTRDFTQTVPFNPIISMGEDSKGNLWTASEDGLSRVDRVAGKMIRYRLDVGDRAAKYPGLSTLHADRDDALWMATSDGLLMLNRERTRVVHYRNNPADPETLSGNSVLAIYEDREGNMWVGTDDGGLDRFPTKPPPFKHFRHEPGNENSLDSNHIRSILEDSSGVLWVGTLNSLDKLDRKNGVVAHYRRTGGSGQLSSTVILSSAEDRQGDLWFGTLNHGLNRLDPRTGKFRTWFHDRSDPNSLSDDAVTKLLVDSKGRLWVGTVAGLDLFDGAGFQHLAQVRIVDIAEDQAGTLWIATRASGLLHLDPDTGKQESYRASSAPAILSNDQTTGLCVDHTGAVWIGTVYGLNRLDPQTGKFRAYYERDGLSNNAVSRILEDDAGNLWVSTGYGISRLNPRAGAFTNYDASDGIGGNEFYGYASAWKSRRTGEMFFSSYSGLTAFSPREVGDNPYVPPVAITNLRVTSGPAPQAKNKAYPLRAGMRLPALVRDIRFDYAALSFVAPGKIRFKYKLEGYDREWQDAGDRRQAFYTGLPPRSYRFRVTAANSSGVWNEAGAILDFSIAPAYYQTNWFIALLAAAIMAAAAGAYRYRMWQVQRESRRLRDVIDTIPAYVWSAQPDGAIDFVNHRWLEFTGFSADQALGWGWVEAVHPEDHARLVDAWRAGIASGEAMEEEARMRGADGEYRLLSFRAVPLRDESGKIVKWYGKSMDIEDRKRAEQERERVRQLETDLAHINRVSMMGELSASIAHEVNQPLTGIVSNGSACVRWLAGDTPNLEEARGAIRDIVRDGKRAGDVIARIRALTKRTSAPADKLDLNETIREVLAIVGDQARKDSVAVQTEFAGGLAPVSGDRVQLQQVLLNLIMNAMEAMRSVNDRPRQIVITTRNIDPGEVQVTVEDSGTGMDSNAMSRIFDAFYTTKASGMGMGLSISRSILQNHGGRLWATANDGPGTSFHFTLPKYQEQHAGPRAV